MNRLFFLVGIFFFSSIVFAQSTNFVYLQTEPAQPFQVKLNGNVFSSSQSGYLILSKLTDTAYTIEVSFPSNKWPVQLFKLIVQQMDRGYLLKDFGDKGWGLMDWRSLAIQYSNKSSLATLNSTTNTLLVDSTDFSTLLSLAAGDPTLRARNEQKKDTVKTAPVEVEKAPVSEAPLVTPVVPPSKVVAQDSSLAPKTVVVPAESTVLAIDTVTNARCKEAANTIVFQETQQALESASNDMKRLVSASKYFQSNCYSFSQVKQLCLLFKTDEGKYDFLLEAWLYVTNRSHYEQLVSVFTNQEIAVRFKEMIQ
jgi:hypothetical protein